MTTWDTCMLKVGNVSVPQFKCLEIIFSNILNVIISLSVFALFVMLLVGGFKFLTAGGDPKAVAGAKATLTYAIIGLALLSIAFLVFRLIELFTGASILNFRIDEIPSP